MFKSVFSKFLLAFVLIITVCLSMFLMVVYGIVNNYAADIKMDSARQVAEAVRDYIYAEVQEGNLMPPEDEGDMDWMLRLATTSTDRMLVILTDASGVPVAIQSNYGVEVSDEFRLPDNAMLALQGGVEVKNPTYFHQSIKDSQLVYALPIMHEGEMIGAVVVSSPSAR